MQTIKLDIAQKNNVPLLYVKQRDVGHTFAIELYENGTPYSVNENDGFSVWYSGASGDGNYTNIGDETAVFADRNVIIVQMIMQMLNEPGGHEMCVVMYGQDNEQKGFWNIPYYVEAIPGADSAGAQAYYESFLDAQRRAEEAAERAEEAAARAEASGGGGSGYSVLYTPQTLNPEQQAQARENIGAVNEGFVRVEVAEQLEESLDPVWQDLDELKDKTKDKAYELITTITFEKDSTLLLTDIDGIPIKFSRIMLLCDVTNSQGIQIFLGFPGTSVRASAVNWAGNTVKQACYGEFWMQNGFWRGEWSFNTNFYVQGDIYRAGYNRIVAYPVDYARRYISEVYSDSIFPAGTVLKIYAVRYEGD